MVNELKAVIDELSGQRGWTIARHSDARLDKDDPPTDLVLQ
jgi:hypothetical protein